MKITFLIPPVLDGDKPTERTTGCTYAIYPMPNIYELTVAAVLEQEGHEIAYLDCIEKKFDSSEFENYLLNDKSNFYSIWSVNLGITNDITVHEFIRKHQKDAYIMFIGPAPTFFIEKFLIDERTFVVRGEPEITVKELVKCIESNYSLSNIKGVSYLNNGVIINNPERPLLKSLDELPFPARHLLNRDYYHNPKLRKNNYTAMITSRNCPHNCIYCVPNSLTFARELEHKRYHSTKPPIALRSIKNIIEEINLVKQQGYKAVGFQDDNFIWNESRTKQICDSLRKDGLVWGCQARADSITDNIAKYLSESGCMYVDIGVESFDQNILDYIKKDVTVEQIQNAIALLKKYNVPVKLNILFGTSPLETKKTIKETYKTIKEIGVNQVMFNIAAPFPGTEFYDICKKNGWLIGGEYTPVDVQKSAIVNYPNLSKNDLERAIFWGNVKFFLRPSFIIRNLAKVTSFKNLKVSAIALKRKLIG